MQLSGIVTGKAILCRTKGQGPASIVHLDVALGKARESEERRSEGLDFLHPGSPGPPGPGNCSKVFGVFVSLSFIIYIYT